MRSKLLLFLLIIISILITSCTYRTNPNIEKTNLSGVWKFKASDDSVWLPAKIPGCNYLDLLNNKRIKDPFKNDFEKNAQWVAEENWIYQKHFTVPDGYFDFNNIELQFNGLDSWVNIYLNDSFLLETDNMFRTWQIDCKHLLKKGNNILRIEFLSPLKQNKMLSQKMKYQLPDERAYTRKAPFQFGWDWGPVLPSSGIWKPVYLIAWNKIKLIEFSISSETVNDKIAEGSFKINLAVSESGNYHFRIEDMLNDPLVEQDLFLKKGNQSVEIPFQIKEPHLWFPFDLGKPFRYTFNLLLSGNGVEITEQVKTGFADIKLIQEKDSLGETFYFSVNGKTEFIKGANYVPMDNFPSRIPSEKQNALLTMAKNANMNMLRVWGGGIYETDHFYDVCDSLGILIWQDFMYACAMYPGSKQFLKTSKAEAKEQISRLRHHPSLALWCGNNEVDNGWKDWGWQKQFNYSIEDSIEIYKAYKKLFNELLPDLVDSLDPTTCYISSSPRWGWGHPESLTQGDNHYWGVWWGMEDFSKYKEKTGRFMSEYGFQAYPNLSFLKNYIDTNALYLQSPELKQHQKHPRGYQTITEYMAREFPIPEKLDDYIYVSQLLQAKGIGYAIEQHRLVQARCMGTLFWQLNDSWPVISWSAIDYDLNPKALYYTCKELFQKIILVAEYDSELKIHVVSDSVKPVNGSLNLRIVDFYGRILFEKTKPLTINKGVQLIYNLNTDSLNFFNESECFVHISLKGGSGLITEKNFIFAKPKDLHLPNAQITINKESGKENGILLIKSDVFVRKVALEHENIIFEENYFDLLPGTPKSVSYKTKQGSNPVNIEEIKVNYLNRQLPVN